jgi:hypothetical protein
LKVIGKDKVMTNTGAGNFLTKKKAPALANAAKTDNGGWMRIGAAEMESDGRKYRVSG